MKEAEHRNPAEGSTERPSAEQALYETEVDVRQLAENLHEVFWVFDPEREQLLYVSPAYEEIWGRPTQALLDDFGEWVRSVHPDDREYATRSLEEIAETGGGGERVYRIVRPDGSVHWVSDRGFAIYGEDGGVQRIAGMVVDVTDRRRAAAMLRDSQELFRALVENSPDVIARFDRECRHLYVSPAISRYVDLTPEDYIGKTNRDLGFSEELVETWDGAIGRVFETGDVQEFEFVLEGRLGRTVFRCRMAPEHDQDGQVQSVISVAREVTEQSRAEEKLRESEARYRRLVEGGPDIVYIYSDQRGALYWSPRVKDVLGFTPQDLQEDPFLWHDSIHPDDLDRVDRAVGDREHGKHAELEYRVRDVDGEWHWFSDRFIGKSQAGDEILVEGLATDITERKLAQEKLRQLAEGQAALYAISAAASTSLAPGEMLSSALDAMMSATGADAGWVVLPGPTLDDPPHIAVSRGTPESFLEAEASRPLRACPLCPPMLEGDDLRVESVLLGECLCPPQEALVEGNLDEVTVIPLSADDRALGFLHVAWARSAPDIDRAFLATAGRAIGLALRNSQLYQEARQVPGLQTVNRVAAAAISALDEEVLLRRILEMTCQALNAVGGAVFLRDPATGEMRLAMGLSGEVGQVRGMRFEREQGIAGWVLEHDRPLHLTEVARDPRFAEEVDAAVVPEVESLICAPMRHVEESIGVIEILSKGNGRFGENDLSLLESVAAIAAVALRNASLFRDLAELLREHRETQAQLIHAEKMSALGRLTASLAHEISNPLQAVQGYLSLTKEGWGDPERRDVLSRYLAIAVEEVERISNIVRRTRDFYRRAPAGLRTIDVRAELERVLEITQKELEHSDVRVECDWAPTTGEEAVTVEASADQLRQVFLNLVLNAVDAMPEGGVLRISTAVERAAEDGPPRARIAFADTGAGIAPEVQGHLFEPFFTTKEEGSGLGLSISYGIVQAHGGEISVTSEAGQGSTFTVWLPLERPSEEADGGNGEDPDRG